jgi:hypothetical protein
MMLYTHPPLRPGAGWPGHVLAITYNGNSSRLKQIAEFMTWVRRPWNQIIFSAGTNGARNGRPVLPGPDDAVRFC